MKAEKTRNVRRDEADTAVALTDEQLSQVVGGVNRYESFSVDDGGTGKEFHIYENETDRDFEAEAKEQNKWPF